MSNLNLQLIETASDFLKLESDWRALLERAPHSFFQTWEYTATWVKHYGQDVSFRVMVARDALGVAHAIAPFVLAPGRSRARSRLRHLTMLGGLCESLGEYLDILAAPGWEDEALPEFARLLKQEDCFEADSLYIELSQDSSLICQLLRGPLQFFGQAHERGRYPGNFVEIPGDWASFLATRDKKFRKEITRFAGRLTNDHAMEIRHAGVDYPLDAAWDALIRLNAGRWGVDNVYASPQFLAFHRELSALLAERGWLVMPVMLAEGQVISARYDFAYQGKAYGFQGGWDPAWGKFKIGQLLFAHCMQWGLEQRGCREYDFMAGGWEYQRFWTTGSREFTSWETLNRRTLKGGAFLLLRRLKHRLAGLKAAASL